MPKDFLDNALNIFLSYCKENQQKACSMSNSQKERKICQHCKLHFRFFWRKSTKLKSFDCHSKISSKVSGTCRTLPNALSEQINAVAWLKCFNLWNSKIQSIFLETCRTP